MELKRSYRRRGTPDLPLAVYLNDASIAGHHPFPEYHPETEIVLMQTGHTILQLNGVSHSFAQGDIFIIPGNAVHYYQSFSPDAKFCSIVFSSDAVTMHPTHFFQKTFVQPLAEGRLQLPTLLQPEHPAYNTVLAQINQICNCRIYEPDFKLHRFSALMNICTSLMPYCKELSDDRPVTDPGNEAIRMCMRHIHNKHAQKLTLEELAQEAHLHPNYLCTLFKNYTGQTVFEYLTRFRVESAALLLQHQEIPAGKVGELVGFHSESLFYRKFKEIMGITPKAYARQQKANKTSP